MSNVQIVLCSFPDLPKARHIGTLMIEKQLVACVNLIPAVESIFSWEGRTTLEHEVLAVFKTTSERLIELEQELGALHPYEVPEFLVVPVAAGGEDYLKWVQTVTAR
ncbi:MAG: divalent-cation tolerance protein CutA [Roseibacillus sp.]|nr:divalent-cation tolerance protein CutA [Roseibacillus sp.]HCQ38740.1 divalent-cation tolerance protein CutA [Verrucomicrobiales bacterium]|tara:strand:+ start:351 stop:671 length:321 start_codon:yes stop_codon:yes gene_type:complete